MKGLFAVAALLALSGCWRAVTYQSTGDAGRACARRCRESKYRCYSVSPNIARGECDVDESQCIRECPEITNFKPAGRSLW